MTTCKKTASEATAGQESSPIHGLQVRPDVSEIAWRLAQQCRSVVQACLREEEWQDVDREFCEVIARSVNVWSKQ